MDGYISLPFTTGTSPVQLTAASAPRYTQTHDLNKQPADRDIPGDHSRKLSSTSIFSTSSLTNSTATTTSSVFPEAQVVVEETEEHRRNRYSRIRKSSADHNHKEVTRPHLRKRRKYSTSTLAIPQASASITSNARIEGDDDGQDTKSLHAGDNLSSYAKSFAPTSPRYPELYFAYSPAYIQSTPKHELSSPFTSVTTPGQDTPFFLYTDQTSAGGWKFSDRRMSGVGPEQPANDEPASCSPLELPIRTSPPDTLYKLNILDMLALDPRATFIIGAASLPPESTVVADVPASSDIHDMQLELVYHNDAFSRLMPDGAFNGDAESVKVSSDYETSFVLTDPGMKEWVSTSFTSDREYELKPNYVCTSRFLWSKTPVRVPGGLTWMIFSGVLLPAAIGNCVNLVVGRLFESVGQESRVSSISKLDINLEGEDPASKTTISKEEDVNMQLHVELVLPQDEDIEHDYLMAFQPTNSLSSTEIDNKAPSTIEKQKIETFGAVGTRDGSSFVIDSPVSTTAARLIHGVASDREVNELLSPPAALEEDAEALVMEGTSPTPQPPTAEEGEAELEMSSVYSPHSPSDFGFFDWTRLPTSVVNSNHTDLIRKVNWAATSIGPMSAWPQSLRTMICLVLQSPNPSAMYWGSDFNIIYNEAYIPMIQGKHPIILGQSYPVAWKELWHGVKDSFEQSIKTGKPTMKEDDRLFMLRSGFLEETFFSWSIVPIIGEDGTVCGLYNPCFDKTRRVIAERRMLTLREVGERAATARELKFYWNSVMLGLSTNPWDTPFAILYSAKEVDGSESDASSAYASSLSGQRIFNLEGTLGVPEGHRAAPATMDLKNASEGFAVAFKEALSVEGNIFLDRDAGTLPDELLEGIQFRGFEEPCKSAVVCPIFPNGESVLGFLVLGINPRRPFDDDYRLFIQLLTRQLTSSVASTVLYEEEVKRNQRATRLAQMDRINLEGELAQKTKDARDSELKFQRMAEFAPVGMFIADFQGTITQFNDMWYEISQHPRAHDRSSWLNSVDPRDQARVETMWSQVVHEKLKITWEFRWKTPWKTASGEATDRWVLMSCSPEIDNDGMLLCIFGTMTNITDQKLAEAFQKQRVDEVVELKRQQDNFVDIASHEMRNPLSAILQCTDAVIASLEAFKIGSSDNSFLLQIDDSIDVAQTISVCAQHQKRVVDDILTMSKLDSQLLLITPIDTQPISVVMQAFKIFEQESENSDIKMEFNVEESYTNLKIDWVKLDPSRLLQVLINLLTNALKFLRQENNRTVTVSVGASLTRPTEKDDVHFFPSARDSEDCTSLPEWGNMEEVYLSFSVIDSGRGLTEEQMGLLFQRFQQATPRTHVQYGGSGLGLFICRELVSLQQGAIGVQSRAGKGCVFSFYIKCRRSTRPEVEVINLPPRSNSSSQPKIKFPQPTSSKRAVNKVDRLTKSTRGAPQEKLKADFKVLIVEDNVVNQIVLQKQLSGIGCTTYVANHGQEALDKIAQSKYWRDTSEDAIDLSVVLMDVEMPIMDGLTATKHIRELESQGMINGHIPIIAVTANARSEQIKEMFDAGMDGFVSKPFRIVELLPKIEEVLKRFQEIDNPPMVSEENDVVMEQFMH